MASAWVMLSLLDSFSVAYISSTKEKALTPNGPSRALSASTATVTAGDSRAGAVTYQLRTWVSASNLTRSGGQVVAQDPGPSRAAGPEGRRPETRRGPRSRRDQRHRSSTGYDAGPPVPRGRGRRVSPDALEPLGTQRESAVGTNSRLHGRGHGHAGKRVPRAIERDRARLRRPPPASGRRHARTRSTAPLWPRQHVPAVVAHEGRRRSLRPRKMARRQRWPSRASSTGTFGRRRCGHGPAVMGHLTVHPGATYEHRIVTAAHILGDCGSDRIQSSPSLASNVRGSTRVLRALRRPKAPVVSAPPPRPLLPFDLKATVVYGW